MTRSEELAQAFVKEVAYLQGGIYSLPYAVRSRQWMSIRTVAGLLAHYEKIDVAQFAKDCGFDSNELQKWNTDVV